MGFIDKFLGRKDKRPVIAENGMVVIRRRELAELMKQPKAANFSEDKPGPCEQCGKPLEEALITTGGPLGDPELWRDLPVAVDGWACIDCGVFRYPRRMEPTAITVLGEEGVKHGQAGRYADAEWCFARIVWNWPGYLAGHLNYAEALRDRLHRAESEDEQTRRRITRRMVEQYEEAIDAYQQAPRQGAVAAIGRACITVAEVALDDRALDRARRFVEICLALPELPEADGTLAREFQDYIHTRRDLFDAASQVLGSRIRLSGRPAQPPATPDERKQMAQAIEGLAQHIELAPDRWQSAWLHAKALHLVGKHADAFAAWGRAFERFPAERDLARDYSLELLEADRIAEARAVARAIAERLPDDATLWCNLSVTELLSNDLDAAEAALARSRKLDPGDKIAALLETQLDGYRHGKPMPKSIRELERRA